METYNQKKAELEGKSADWLKEPQQAVAEAEKRLRDLEALKAQGQSVSGQIWDAKRWLVDKQFELLKVQQVRIPKISYTAYEQIQNNPMDPKLELEMHQLNQRLIQAEHKLDTDHLKARIPILQSWAAEDPQSGAPNRLALDQAGLAQKENEALVGDHEFVSMIPPAQRLGDQVHLRKGYGAKVRQYLKDKKERPADARVDDLCRHLTQMADDIAMLTGDREEAASILRLVYQLTLDASKPEDRARVQENLEKQALPTWFPPGKDLKSVSPADLNSLGSPL